MRFRIKMLRFYFSIKNAILEILNQFVFVQQRNFQLVNTIINFVNDLIVLFFLFAKFFHRIIFRIFVQFTIKIDRSN